MTDNDTLRRRRFRFGVGALSMLLGPLLFVALGAAALTYQDAAYSTLSDWQKWTYSGGSMVATASDLASVAGITTGNPAVSGDWASSPALTYIPSNDSITVSYHREDSGTPGAATVAFQASWDGAAFASSTPSCAAGVCTVALTAPAAGSYHTLGLKFLVTAAGGWSSFDTMTVTDNTATQSYNPGTWTTPTLDINALSTQMVAFWNFMAPAVYIVGGISLGGLIVWKVRTLI